MMAAKFSTEPSVMLSGRPLPPLKCPTGGRDPCPSQVLSTASLSSGLGLMLRSKKVLLASKLGVWEERHARQSKVMGAKRLFFSSSCEPQSWENWGRKDSRADSLPSGIPLGLFLVLSRLDAVDDHGMTALHHTAFEGQMSTVKLLLVPGPGSAEAFSRSEERL